MKEISHARAALFCVRWLSGWLARPESARAPTWGKHLERTLGELDRHLDALQRADFRKFRGMRTAPVEAFGLVAHSWHDLARSVTESAVGLLRDPRIDKASALARFDEAGIRRALVGIDLEHAHAITADAKPNRKGDAPNGAVFNRTTKTITLNGKTITLSPGERHVISRLTETGTATLGELQAAHSRPDRVLKGLREKYERRLGKYISLPGGPGKGGYSTTIVARE